MGKKIEIKKGDIYGNFTIIKESKPYIYGSGKKYRKVEAVCKCGNIKTYGISSLISGHTKSCGCFKHNMSKTRIYNIRTCMKSRCNNKNNPKYEDYGGRGIKVCKEWNESFEEFKKDMYDGYIKYKKRYGSKQTTIDRVDNNGNYTKENCRWSNYKKQSRNRRTTLMYKTRSIIERCERLSLDYKVVYNRLYNLGWTIDEALNISGRPYPKNNKK